MSMRALPVVLGLLAAGCSKNSQPPEGEALVSRAEPGAPPPKGATERGPTARPSGMPSTPGAPPAAVPAPAGGGLAVYMARCSNCHGREGRGDGLMAQSFPVRPRTFADAAWQASVTDAQIARVIVEGSAAIGKSPTMPPSPDLGGQPDLVADLVAIVRGFGAR